MFILNGKPLSPDTAFIHDDIQYPANWLRLATLEEREAIGITEIPDPAPYDTRFYFGYDDKGDLIPRDHQQVVEQWINQTCATAGNLLAVTDWQIIREVDNGTVVKPEIKAWRQNIRLSCNEKVIYIGTTNSTPEVATYIVSSVYATWPSDPNTLGPALTNTPAE